MPSDWNRRDFLRTSTAAAGALLVPRAARAADGLDLVRDGRSAYTIVKPAAATPSQAYAATELQAFLRQMSGATLPITTDDGPLPERAILLGVTRHTDRVAGRTDLAALGDDGFRLVTRDGHLAIVGSGVRGTLYGVYELLEQFGGCRWYASFHSVIPQKRTWTLPALDQTQVPAFPSREPFWFDMFEGDFAARCKANGSSMRLEAKHGGNIRFGGGLFVHTAYTVMPPQEFFATHPEYYSELGGKRTADFAQLCLTNPDVVRIFTERVLERIRKDPGGKLFSVSQNDWHNNCTCANCRAVDEREGSPSGSLIQFVNQVAEAVEREFPNVWIETLAYQYTRHAPKTIRPRKNVVPRLCSIECDFSKPLPVSTDPQNRSFVEDIRAWSSMTDKLFIWDYVTSFSHYLCPFPNFAALQGNVQFFRDNHAVGIFEEGAYGGKHAEFAELHAWLLAKLLWNPDAKVDALYDDFFTGYYGAAAEPVRTYFAELQALVTGKDERLYIWATPKAPVLTDAFIDHGTKLWAEAERRVKDDPAASYRVRMSALPILYSRLIRWPAMKVNQRLERGVLKPLGVDPEYAALATEFLARATEGKVLLSENRQYHEQFLADLRARTVGMPLQQLTSGAVSCGVAAELGAAVLSLETAGQQFLAAPGGLDLVNTHSGYWNATSSRYTATAGGDAPTFHTALLPTVASDRKIRLVGGAVEATTTLSTKQADGVPIWPVVRAALDLGDAAAIAVKPGGGEWLPLPVPADRNLLVHTLPSVPRELVIGSAVTGRGARLVLPEVTGRVLLTCDVAAKRVDVYLAVPPTRLAADKPLALPLLVTPLPKVDGLPAVTPAAGHTPGVVTVEEVFINLGQPGTWGEITADPAADDGWAAKLYHTHYEWCLQWPVRPELFAPGAAYRARARVRVETTGRDGWAFYAGIYDVARKKSWGQVQPKTGDVKPGYQWYDLGTWTPEADQYVWAGPGPFDKQKGDKSAIEAVYVDKFEFVKVG